MATKLCGRLDKLAVAGFVSLAFVGALQAATIKLTAPAELYALSMLAHLLGLNEVGRTEQALRAAEERRRGARLPEGMV